jgi:hypothetical protein
VTTAAIEAPDSTNAFNEATAKSGVPKKTIFKSLNDAIMPAKLHAKNILTVFY